MIPVLVGIGLIAIIFYLGNSGSAEADCHCCCETEDSGMSKYGYSDLVTLAENAGFGCDAATAAAIAIAESGGDPGAYNPESQVCTPEGMGSYGLWQIYLNKHSEFAGMDLTDPQTNANAAFRIYSDAGNSFHPWSTFKSGKYREYLQ